MALSLHNAEFWLPTQFLTENDVLMDKENFNKNNTDGSITGLCPPTSSLAFPTKFLSKFNSFNYNSALSSLVDLVDTESSDEEDFFLVLTHQLAHSMLYKT